MGACKSCSRVVLILINVLFSLIGLAMLIVGSIVRWGTEIMDQYLSDLYAELAKTLQEHNVDISEFNIGDLIGDVTLSFIVIGAFFFVIGILGCVGACCTVRPMLILYIVILTILVLAEVAFVVVLFAAQDKVDTWLKKPFKATIKHYDGIDGTDGVTLGLNFIMSRFDCCGVEGFQDFNDSLDWNRTYFDDGIRKEKELPAICCKNVTDKVCFGSPEKNNSYFDKGCYDAVKSWLTENFQPLVGTSAGVLVVEIILVIFAFVACVRDKKGDYDDDSYHKPVMDDRPFDAIRAYDHGPPSHRDYNYQGGSYHGPHHNHQPYRPGPHENRAYQGSEYDYPNGRRNRRY